MKKEYVVLFTDSMQIGPNDFIPVDRALKVTSDTKISEIEDFFRKYDMVGIIRFKVNELQQLNPQK